MKIPRDVAAALARNLYARAKEAQYDAGEPTVLVMLPCGGTGTYFVPEDYPARHEFHHGRVAERRELRHPDAPHIPVFYYFMPPQALE